MKRKFFRIAAFLLLPIALLSCAEQNDIDLTPFRSEAFERWMAKYHPEATRLENGIYNGIYVEWIEQNPDAPTLRSGYWMQLDYTAQDQNGDIFLTRNRETAHLMQGPYFDSVNVRYIPEQIQYEPNTLMNDYARGQVYALSMMHEGDSLRIYLPPALGYLGGYTFDYYSYSYVNVPGFSYSSEKHYGYAPYLIEVPSDLGLIFDMKLNKVIKDINLHERQQVERFAADSLGILNPADSIALGVYFKKLVENPDGDSVKLNSTANVFYVGRFLDGFVFDTNIDSISIAVGKGSVSGTPVSFDPSSISGDKAAIGGIRAALLQMQAGERARVVMVSDQAYGDENQYSDGTTSFLTIPGYSPLEFEIYVDSVEYPKEEEDEEDDGDE